MSSLLRKAARVNLVAMDFVLQVTVEELVLEMLNVARTLSFELSRGAKVCLQCCYCVVVGELSQPEDMYGDIDMLFVCFGVD